MAPVPKIEQSKHQAPARGLPATTGGRLLTPEEVAHLLGLSVETLAQWRSQRKGIPFVKLSRNVVRYLQVDLDSWIAERTVTVREDRTSARGHD